MKVAFGDNTDKAQIEAEGEVTHGEGKVSLAGNGDGVLEKEEEEG